ncbi:hypothetical protein VNO78_21514 [Psophocarpus tetragonolobus]|uniref:Protein kinase domain-containing protein n=1 Tax=Psophocarpus tetragonolobus TaxID=3891 RepID=A0AAN9SBW4_PSOTE
MVVVKGKVSDEHRIRILYKHCHPTVIHRDMNSSNILLEPNFNAKLSDFGLAITDGSQSKKNIKLSGTMGYVALEYLLDGKLSDKSDVYAFGVVLLELILGRKPVEKLAPAHGMCTKSSNFYLLRGLSEEDSLSLFVKLAFKEGEEKKYPQLLEIARKIVKKCGGIRWR